MVQDLSSPKNISIWIALTAGAAQTKPVQGLAFPWKKPVDQSKQCSPIIKTLGKPAAVHFCDHNFQMVNNMWHRSAKRSLWNRQGYWGDQIDASAEEATAPGVVVEEQPKRRKKLVEE